jgi:hypothetical protein
MLSSSSSVSSLLARRVVGVVGKNKAAAADVAAATLTTGEHAAKCFLSTAPNVAAKKQHPKYEEVTFLRLNNLQDNPGAVKNVRFCVP